jgi:hypothetical protein
MHRIHVHVSNSRLRRAHAVPVHVKPESVKHGGGGRAKWGPCLRSICRLGKSCFYIWRRRCASSVDPISRQHGSKRERAGVPNAELSWGLMSSWFGALAFAAGALPACSGCASARRRRAAIGAAGPFSRRGQRVVVRRFSALAHPARGAARRRMFVLRGRCGGLPALSHPSRRAGRCRMLVRRRRCGRRGLRSRRGRRKLRGGCHTCRGRGWCAVA